MLVKGGEVLAPPARARAAARLGLVRGGARLRQPAPAAGADRGRAGARGPGHGRGRARDARMDRRAADLRAGPFPPDRLGDLRQGARLPAVRPAAARGAGGDRGGARRLRRDAATRAGSTTPRRRGTGSSAPTTAASCSPILRPDEAATGSIPRGANENCGAESILAFQLAHYSMLALARAQQRDSSGEHGGRRRTRSE